MARVAVPIYVADPATGNAVANATATVKNAVTNTNVTVYAAKTGPTTVANPVITDSYGREKVFVDRQAVKITYAGTGLSSWDEYRDLAAAGDNEIDTAWLGTASAPADDSLTAQKLDPATVRAILGLNATASVRRGKSIIATTETLTAPVAFSFAATPDRVQNIVLPTDGIIRVRFQGTWSESVGGSGNAAIFIGANQAVIAAIQGATGPLTEAASTVPMVGSAGASTADKPLCTFPGGLISGLSQTSAYTGDVTTGQILGLSANAGGGGADIGKVVIGGTVFANTAFGPHGGVCEIFAAAGTYDVGIKYKAASGNITVKNRKLWVEAVSFG